MSSQSSPKVSRQHNVRDLEAERLPYFHHRLRHVDVEPILQKTGDFVLRQIRYDGVNTYVVSVRLDNGVKHFPVQRDNSRWCFEMKRFTDIRRLIEWHISTGRPLTHDSGARIERPMDRQPWELFNADIEMIRLLGRASFGNVFEAMCKGRLIAVKTLDRMPSEREDMIEMARTEMLEEARIMRAVGGHENVVEAVGVTIDLEIPLAAMETVKGKSLDKLRSELEDFPIDVKVRLAGEAAAGLVHIHSKGFLHRDMAARNCLVEMTPDVGRLKLTDFGMAKYVGIGGVYKPKNVSQLPVRWSALESLEHKTWTAKSDVWSLGVLAWEIFTNGGLPFNEIPELPLSTMVAILKEGKRLEIPPEVPKAVADTMQKCWDADQAKRPTADEFHNACVRSVGKK